MELEHPLPPLADDRLLRIVACLREYEPEATAVLAVGSYARGTADAARDLDLVAITPRPRNRYRMWFDDALHVSAPAKTGNEWLARRSAPAGWTRELGLAVTIEPVYLLADAETRALLGDPPSHLHPPGPPELEDFVETAVKTRRALRSGDSAAARWHAQAGAMLAPRLLLDLNEQPPVANRDEALAAALAFTVAPERWRDDLAEALAVVDGDSTAALLRLASALLPFLREHAPDVDPQPEIGRYLRDGTLERLLA